MQEVTQERIDKIKEILKRMLGRLVPGFNWDNHPFTPYYYNEKNDSFDCMGVSISIDIPTEELTLPKILYRVKDLEKKVYRHYRDVHNIDLGLKCYD